MKKTLSIILSLLMVLSTVTCMFTMPVSAEEAATTVVETLPVNDFITNTGKKTITPESAWVKGDYTFNKAVALNIRGWNKKTDEQGNVTGQNDSYIDSGIVHQMTFDVTVSEDVNAGVKLFPAFISTASPQYLSGFVGVRNDVNVPNRVFTAYNVSAVDGGKAGETGTSAANAAELEAGKTYTYTYIFNTSSPYISTILIIADGLTAGSVEIGEVKIFPAKETIAGNFQMTTKLIPFAVEQDGNVFARLYGYRAVGVNGINGNTTIASAKVGSDLYSFMIKGGNTYNFEFDFRMSAYGSAGNELDFDDLNAWSPTFDFYETGALDYTEEYAAIKDASDGTSFKIDEGKDKTTEQRTYNGPNYGYSYFYANSGSKTYNRRVGATAGIEFTKNGTVLYSNTENGSGQGRSAKGKVCNKGWMDAKYTLNAMGAQTIQEAAVAGAARSSSNNQNMRYTYDSATDSMVYNSAYNNLYVPAEQDVTCAFGLDNLYDSVVYDFDNFTLKSEVPVEAEYYDEVSFQSIANTSHNATIYTDVLENKTYASIDLFESDTLVFEGWKDAEDNVVSMEAEFEVPEGVDTEGLRPVFTSKNILEYAGGFEDYEANTNLEADFVEVTAGDANYPNYTGGTFRYYTSVPPTGDEWTGWDSNTKLSHLKDSDSGVTTAQIISDIEEAGGIINSKGSTSFTYFNGFPTVVEGNQNATTYADAGQKYGKGSVVVAPYSGDKMLRLQASTRTGFRALEGLEAGKTYTLRFYAYNPYAYYFLKNVYVTDYPAVPSDDEESITQLAGLSLPYDAVTEDIHAADGSVEKANKSIQKAKAEYVGKWFEVELTFTANSDVAYLGLTNQHSDFTSGYTYIDELTLVEYDCSGNHRYDDFNDLDCNVCGEARTFPSSWDFENGSTENITVRGNSEIKVVDAVDQPEKIGDKYLQYTSASFDGMVFNFVYEQGYKYRISYDFKIFEYGTGSVANGIDHIITPYDDGLYGAPSGGNGTALAPYNENIVTRYKEDGTVIEKATCFSDAKNGNNFYGTKSHKDEAGNTVYDKEMAAYLGGSEVWDNWQHFEIEIGNAGDYEGLAEYGIRPNDAGWVVGVDNFKVEKIATSIIGEAEAATDGTNSFAIRARTAEKKQGLRFKSTINLDKLNLADGAKIVEYGTLAMKKSDADQGYFLRREVATDRTAKGKVVAGVAYNAENGTDVRYALDGSTLTYTGVLTGIGVKNYDVDFLVCGYAIVETADGQQITVYDSQVTMSVYDAAQQIIAESADADDVAVAKTVVETYDAYVAAQPAE